MHESGCPCGEAAERDQVQGPLKTLRDQVCRRYVDDCQEKITGSVVAMESHSSDISSEEPLDLLDISAKSTLSPACSHTITKHVWSARARPFLVVGGLLSSLLVLCPLWPGADFSHY